MKCPFCAEHVKDEAVVCKHCHHDLSVVRALLDRINELTKQLENLQPGQVVAARELATSRLPGAHDRVGMITGAIERRVPLVSPLTTLLMALGALLGAHFLIVVHYDLSLIWLHIASLILPFLFGFLYRQNTTEYLSGDLFCRGTCRVGSSTWNTAPASHWRFLPGRCADRRRSR